MEEKQPRSRASQEIDKNLRRVFKEMEDSQVPDRFADLLRQLRDGEKKSGDES